ncbi:hypothetical protein Lser_V15G32595 [Lactuca serriola]
MESQPSTSSSMEESQPCRVFEFHEILSATDDFDESLVIGHGGFGKVYKGNVFKGSSHVVAAIKRLDSLSSQGEAEFWAEIEMLFKFRHCNLVSLFGYCNHEKEMILVYEYMPKGTLEDHLHKLGTPLSWLQRLKICIGAGRGLDYLHTGTGIELGVIHRDIKTSNILLHESWAAKISDFGLSRIGPTNQPSTYVNTLVKGTFGYFDPNYFITGKLTRKSDVYAFGVVLLEVLCRKRAVDKSLDEGLVTWARDSIKDGNLKTIIDPDIRGQISAKCLKEFVRIVERCLLSSPKQRPTMAEVIVSLDSVLTLQEKANGSLQAAGKTMFGRMRDMFLFPTNGDNSGISSSLYTSPLDLKLSSKGNSGNADDDIVVADNSRNTSLKVVKFADLERATRDFSFCLYMDGLGKVFLGWLDEDTFVPSTEGVGVAVAVKRYNNLQYWQTEVSILGRLSHRNIISLLGYCDDKDHKFLLVYKYMQNRNLGDFLFTDARDVAEPLSWETRLKIMIGIARALTYMHSSENQVIHRDVKTSKILLDKDFNGKLGGFDLAKFGQETREIDVTTRIVGTIGYTDPKYVSTGHVSAKSDIYSFGVVLLETLTGQRASRKNPPFDIGLVEWASIVLADRSELKKRNSRQQWRLDRRQRRPERKRHREWRRQQGRTQLQQHSSRKDTGIAKSGSERQERQTHQTCGVRRRKNPQRGGGSGDFCNNNHHLTVVAMENGGGTGEDAIGWRPPSGRIIATPQMTSCRSLAAMPSRGGFRLQCDSIAAARWSDTPRRVTVGNGGKESGGCCITLGLGFLFSMR